MYGHSQRHTVKRFDLDVTYAENTNCYMALDSTEHMAGFRNQTWGHERRVDGVLLYSQTREQTFTRPDGTIAWHKRFGA